MKKLITILLILITGLSYGQAPFQWPSMNLYRADQQAQVRNNIKYLNDRSNDSLALILRKEMQKQLSDSLAKLIPADNVTIVVKDGKFTAVGGGTANLKPVYDSIAKVADNLATLTTKVNDLEKQLYDSIGKVASTITPLDTTWKKQIKDLQDNIDALQKDLQNTKKTIPIIDVTYPAVAKVETDVKGEGYVIDAEGNAILSSKFFSENLIYPVTIKIMENSPYMNAGPYKETELIKIK